jgi:hypothetical protein
MTSGNGGTRRLITLFVVFGAAIVGVETLLNRGAVDGTFLFTLTCWTMVVQGCVALAAVAEVAKGLWLIPIKRDLLSFHPLLFFAALLYPFMALRIEIYGWTDHTTAWLNVPFFLGRNMVLLLLAGWVGHLLTRAIMAQDPKKNTYAVYYILIFVASESLIAFDWIMSLEYPWISTLFGGYFFIQSFLMGLLVSTFILLSRARKKETGLTQTSHDAGKMIFGFSFMWAGFFFSQYLPIWYGNIPEEVDYVVKRLGPGRYWALSRVVFLMAFVIPFVILLSRKVKTVPTAMAGLSVMILVGLCLEKVVLIDPVVRVDPVVAVIEGALLVVLASMVYRMRDSFMPQMVMPVIPHHDMDDAHDAL